MFYMFVTIKTDQKNVSVQLSKSTYTVLWVNVLYKLCQHIEYVIDVMLEISTFFLFFFVFSFYNLDYYVRL